MGERHFTLVGPTPCHTIPHDEGARGHQDHRIRSRYRVVTRHFELVGVLVPFEIGPVVAIEGGHARQCHRSGARNLDAGCGNVDRHDFDRGSEHDR